MFEKGMEMGRTTYNSSTIRVFFVWISVVVIVGETGVVETEMSRNKAVVVMTSRYKLEVEMEPFSFNP